MNSEPKTPAKPSKRPVGRPKGSRDTHPRRVPEKPFLWTFTAFGRVFRFREDVPAFRRVLLAVLFGGVWRRQT